MARPVNTHNIIRHYIGVFATILDEISFVNGHGEVQKVPLVYSSKEKWLSDIREKPDMQQYATAFTLPRMGMELTGMNYAPDRAAAKLARLSDKDGNFVYNRSPWDYSMSVYIGATRMNDANQIVEQIAPYFVPGFTITSQDVQALDLETNATIVLNSVSYNIDAEGSYDQERTILVEMQFTVKGYLYQALGQSEKIKTTILNMRDKDYQTIYERITDRVDPIEAGPDDAHVIVTTQEENPTELP